MIKKIKLFLVSILIAVFCLSAQSLYAQAPYQWTVMVYMAADSADGSMDTAIDDFNNKLSEVSSGDSVAIVAIVGDTFTGDAQYGIVNQGDVFGEWGYSFGEVVDMSSPQTLVGFVGEVVEGETNCPAENYALILWNAAELYPNGKLSIQEVAESLYLIDSYSEGSVEINLIGFDGGSMAMLEAAYEIKDWADVMVASEKEQPLGTWPYQPILEELVADTMMSSAQLSQTIVDKYDDVAGNVDNTLSSVLLAKYSTHDLAGTWYINSLGCGSGEGDCHAFFGGMDISETGLVRQWYGPEFESPDPEMPTQIDIDSNGMVTIDSDELFIGFMSPDKKTITATISDDVGSDTAQIFVLQKRGEDVNFTSSDLAGNWSMHSFDCDSGGNCGWERGEATLSPTAESNTCLMEWTSFVDSDEGEAEEELQDSYLVSINWTDEEENYWNGVVTIKERYESDDPFPFGAMSQSKNVIVGVVENDANDSQIVIFQKKDGVVFDQTDFEGFWVMDGLMCIEHDIGDSEYMAQQLYFWINGIGNMYGYDPEMGTIGETPIGSVGITETGIVSLDAEGISLTDGTMSLDKEMVVINGMEITETDTAYQYYIFQRIRDVSPIQSLADAVSDFADAVLNGVHDDWDKIFLAQQRAGWYLPSSNRDLKSFMQGVVDYAESEPIRTAAQNVIYAFDGCLIGNYSSCPDKDNGLSIYFPLWAYEEVDGRYSEDNLSFLDDIPGNGDAYTQHWDDFLDVYAGYGLPLVPGHSGPKTYSKTIPGGTTASSYVMISSPVFPYADDIEDLDPLTILKDDLGDYNRDIWRLFRWNPSLEPASYEECPFPEYSIEEEDFLEFFEDLFFGGNYVIPGKGYWLISRNTVNIDVTGEQYPTDEPYPIFLHPGWNQIGTPFYFDVDFDTVWVFGLEGGEMVIDGDYIPDFAYTLDATSDENTLTSKILWRYANGSYDSPATMKPGEGYWIYNKKDSNWLVLLVVNPIRSTISDSYRASLERNLTLFAKASGEETPPPPPGGMDPEPDEEGNGSSGGKSGCFIATACFGSPMAGEVEVLRNFRDRYLLSNPLGQVFVSLYYKYSPPIAQFIGNHKFLKIMVRSSLYPIVKGCNLTVEDK